MGSFVVLGGCFFVCRLKFFLEMFLIFVFFFFFFFSFFFFSFSFSFSFSFFFFFRNYFLYAEDEVEKALWMFTIQYIHDSVCFFVFLFFCFLFFVFCFLFFVFCFLFFVLFLLFCFGNRKN